MPLLLRLSVGSEPSRHAVIDRLPQPELQAQRQRLAYQRLADTARRLLYAIEFQMPELDDAKGLALGNINYRSCITASIGNNLFYFPSCWYSFDRSSGILPGKIYAKKNNKNFFVCFLVAALISKMPIISAASFIVDIHQEMYSVMPWSNRGLKAVVQLAWALFIRAISQTWVARCTRH